MAADKLRKYLAYYQKVLKEEPENIEARLRLAAIFREVGRPTHAVEEYVAASKLLAKEGLPLEAIAACKAVLELDPSHTEVQFFLARLYAQVPEATGQSVRIAQPLVSSGDASASHQMPITLRNKKVDDSSESTENADLLHDVWIPQENTDTSIPYLLNEDSEITYVEADDDTSPLAASELPDFETTRRGAYPNPRDPELFATQYLDPVDIIEFDEFPQREREATQEWESARPLETFELGIFDFDSLELDDNIELSFLDDEPEPGSSEIVLPELPTRAVLSVNRAELPEIPLLSKLSPEAFMELIQRVDVKRARSQEIIIEPGEGPKSLQVIVRGEATVRRMIDDRWVELDTMKEGDFFGEFRLLTGRDGEAQIVAKTNVELLELSEETIHEVGDKNPEIWDVLWDFYYARMLNNLLAASDMFKPLSAAQRTALAEKFFLLELVAQEVLLKEGQICEFLYLVLAGEIRVERVRGTLTQDLATMREGEFFGVVSSLGEEPYLANIRAARDTTLLCLPGADFRHVVDSSEEVAREVERVIHSRRELSASFSSGITTYAELGVTRSVDS